MSWKITEKYVGDFLKPEFVIDNGYEILYSKKFDIQHFTSKFEINRDCIIDQDTGISYQDDNEFLLVCRAMHIGRDTETRVNIIANFIRNSSDTRDNLWIVLLSEKDGEPTTLKKAKRTTHRVSDAMPFAPPYGKK